MEMPKELQDKINAAPPSMYEEIIREWVKAEIPHFTIRYKDEPDSIWLRFHTTATDEEEATMNFLRWADSEEISWTTYYIEDEN